MHGYHTPLYGIIIAFNRKKSKQHRNGIFLVTTPQYCAYFHNRHRRGIMQSQGRKFQRNQHLIAISKGEPIMKKLIASAASLTLAATILAGSASAASPLDFLKEFSWKNLFCQSQQADRKGTGSHQHLCNGRHQDRPQPAGRRLHPAQSGLWHRRRCLCRLGRVSGFGSGQDHGKEHPCI